MEIQNIKKSTSLSKDNEKCLNFLYDLDIIPWFSNVYNVFFTQKSLIHNAIKSIKP